MNRTHFLKACACLVLLPLALSAAVTIKQTDDGVCASIDGKPVLHYQLAKVQPPADIDPLYAGSGFIHPLQSPAGRILTDAFPVGHAHQHAIFSAWTRATFHGDTVDFWNKHRRTGYNEAVSVDSVRENGFTVTRRMVSREHGPAVIETWKVTVHDRADVHIIDISLHQEPATGEPVHLQEFIYGGFAYRGSAAWNEAAESTYVGPMQILTGMGTTNRESANNERSRWVAAYGPVEGHVAGVVLMDHPSNFRHPQPVRLHPKMPYFVFAPVILGPFDIDAATPYAARYRIIAYDGVPDAETVEEWYREFAESP